MKVYTGIVTSVKMQKTITVTVTSRWMHPKYKKTVKRTKNYLVHDEKEQAKLNDEVIFIDSKPISKRKRFTLQSVTKK